MPQRREVLPLRTLNARNVRAQPVHRPYPLVVLETIKH